MNQETFEHDRAIYQDLRERLIDRSRRNRLLNFRHSPSAPLVRLVHAAPEQVVAQLRDDARLRFRSLPDPDFDLADEATPEFQAELQRAALNEDYQSAIRRIDPDDPSGFAVFSKLERDLKDEVRPLLKLSKRPRRKEIDLAKHARSLGIIPDYDVPAKEAPTPKRSDSVLQTLLFPDRLKARLAKIYRNTRAIEQETGVNTLHLAIGFLSGLSLTHPAKQCCLHCWSYPSLSSEGLSVEARMSIASRRSIAHLAPI